MFDEKNFDNEFDGIEDESLSIEDIDMLQFDGDFDSDFSNFSEKINKVIAPADRRVIIEGRKQMTKRKRSLKKQFTEELHEQPVRIPKDRIAGERIHEKFTDIDNKVKRVLVSPDRKVIVQGVDELMFSKKPADDLYKRINYYKGEKLNEMLLFIDNSNNSVDFNFELFNSSMPLDYLYNTSLNLNDKIIVAGGQAASYSDLLFNLLANPTMIVNAKFIFTGNVKAQQNQAVTVKQKDIRGFQDAKVINPQFGIDIYQYQTDIAVMSFFESIGRPYIPDGMDVMQYKVLAGNTLIMALYYKQISLKKLVFKEALTSEKLF